jgi:predicted nuclease of predicted toxin-antitoxin system
MIFWIDAQLPPRLANWLVETFNVKAYSLRDLNLRDAEDEQIFQEARQQNVVIISKDSDFVEMVLRLGSPPQLLWVTCGNVTNRRLQSLLLQVFPHAQKLLSTYATGKKCSKNFLENMKIIFDDFLPRWNYRTIP